MKPFLLSWNIFVIACESILGFIIESCKTVQTCLKFNFGKTNDLTYLEKIGREKMESTFPTCMNGFLLRNSASEHLIHSMHEKICWRNNMTFVETVFTKSTYDMFGTSVNVSWSESVFIYPGVNRRVVEATQWNPTTHKPHQGPQFSLWTHFHVHWPSVVTGRWRLLRSEPSKYLCQVVLVDCSRADRAHTMGVYGLPWTSW